MSNLNPEAQKLIDESQVILAKACKEETLALAQELAAARPLRKDQPADPSTPQSGPEDDFPPSPSSETPIPDEQDGPLDHDQLVQELVAMPEEQFQVYASAIAEAQSQRGGEGGPPEAPPEPESGDPLETSEDMPEDESAQDMAMKSEVANLRRQLSKTERAYGSLAQEVKALRKSQAQPSRRAANPNNRPARPPAPELSKAEKVAKLRLLAKSPDLTKGERTTINQWFDNNSVDISHLLSKTAKPV